MRGLEESTDTTRFKGLLSIGAETHLRSELWRTLSKHGFFHNIMKDHRDSRLKTFEVVGGAVREGRKKRGDMAWQNRQDDLDSDSDDEDVDEDEPGSEDAGAVAAGAVADVGVADKW